MVPAQSYQRGYLRNHAPHHICKTKGIYLSPEDPRSSTAAPIRPRSYHSPGGCSCTLSTMTHAIRHRQRLQRKRICGRSVGVHLTLTYRSHCSLPGSLNHYTHSGCVQQHQAAVMSVTTPTRTHRRIPLGTMKRKTHHLCRREISTV